MIRWTHYAEWVPDRGSPSGPARPRTGCTRHTLAFKLFRRYLILTWTWTA